MTSSTRSAPPVLRAALGLVILGAAALLTAGPALAAASPQVSFGVQPASKGRPDSRPNLSYGVTPGSTVRDAVAIDNFSAKALTLSVYATDAVNTSAGGFSLLAGDQKPQDAGAWTAIDGHAAGSPVTIHVPARQAKGPGFVVLPVVLHVPVGTAPGDHVGGVVAVLSTLGKNSQGAKVRLDQRVATRLFVRVSGTSQPRLTIEHLTTTYHPGRLTFGDGSVTVAYTVHNRGNLSLGARQSVHVTGPAGSVNVTRGAADVPLLLPGAEVHESVTVPGVAPFVRLTATVTERPTHPVGSVDPGLPRQIVASTSFWAIPWGWLLLAAGVAGFVGWGIRHRLRLAAARRQRAAAAPAGSRAAVRQGVSS